MIYVDENLPKGDETPQFGHRHVVVQRPRDVHTEFEMLEEIGRGKFGRVRRCNHRESGESFAAKFVLYTRKEDRENVEREVQIMNTLNHPKLLYLLDAYDNARNEMCLVTEYIPGGELFDRVIEDEFVLTEKACICFMKQILDGVSFMHSKNILHLDLKPENILCLTKSGNRIKIIDFGLARIHEPHKKLQVLFGTPEFVAPEVVNFEPISFATDMWAVGVITYVLLSGLSPFMGDTDLETMANVTIAEYDYEDEAFDNVSDIAKDFIDSLLVKTKEKRLSAEACLKHSWLNSVLPEKDLSNTKNNLKTNVSSSHANYYLFDSNTRTMSVASNHEEIVPEGNDEEEEWEWDEDSDNLGNENITNAETLFAQNTHQSSASVPQITHQQVTNRVTEMNLEIRKRRSENDDNSTSNLEGGPTGATEPLLPLPRSTSPATSSLAPSSTKVSKADETSFMFNSLQSLVDLANSNPKSSTAVEPQEPPRPLVHEEKAASMVKTNSSDLVREANEKIRFSIHFDARKHQESQNHSSSSSKFSNVREDLFKVKQDINELKNDLKTAEQPLMDILNYLDSNGPRSSSTSMLKPDNSSVQRPNKHHLFLMETEAELEKLTKTMKAFQPTPPPRTISRQISFGSAQTGSVSHAKKLFETKKLDEEVENLTESNNHPTITSSPFRPLYTPTNGSSTRATPQSMRRRSPSPVVTGNVSRARMRFESGGSVKSSATPTPLVEQPNHQTLPRTFRVNVSSQQSYQPSSNSEKSAINRFLSGSTPGGTSGSSKMAGISGSTTSINHQPTYFAPVENNFLLPSRRKYESNVESAAKFLTETLPNYPGAKITTVPSWNCNRTSSPKLSYLSSDATAVRKMTTNGFQRNII